MASENEYLIAIESALLHWCNVRVNLNSDEKKENTRCAMDLIDVLKETGMRSDKIVKLKIAYAKSINCFTEELRSL